MYMLYPIKNKLLVHIVTEQNTFYIYISSHKRTHFLVLGYITQQTNRIGLFIHELRLNTGFKAVFKVSLL